MNFSVVSKISDFLIRNQKVIEKVGLMGLELAIGTILCNKYDVPMTVGNSHISVSTNRKDPEFELDDLDLIFRPKNPTAAAMLSTTKHAKTLWSDMRKTEAAGDIYTLASKEDVDSDTKEYAVLCMGKIREMVDSDYRKREIQKLIMKLMTEQKTVVAD